MINLPPTSQTNVYQSSVSRTSKRPDNTSKPIHFGTSSSRTATSEFDKFWKMNLLQKLTVVLLGPPIMLCTFFLKHIAFRKEDIAHTLAEERGEKSSFKKSLDRDRNGRLPLPEKPFNMDSVIRAVRFVFWNQFGSDALVKATVHLDPDYQPYTPNLQSHKVHRDDEEEIQDLNADLRKYEVPDPPPKLSALDRFFLKYYFHTKPSWECTESERQATSARYKDSAEC
jgi:hypothetical protein